MDESTETVVAEPMRVFVVNQADPMTKAAWTVGAALATLIVTKVGGEAIDSGITWWRGRKQKKADQKND